jgi:inosose dehydratase
LKIRGFSTNMYGWVERWKKDGKTPDWGEIFYACALAGLDAVEIDPTEEKLRLARENGLSVSASYVGIPLHLPFETLEIERTVLPFAERLAATEATDLLINADPLNWKNPDVKSEADFKMQGENLSRIAELVLPMGLKVCMHNHAADNHNALGDLRSVTKYADEQVGLCVDSGWAYVAECDPIEWVRTYPNRVFALHLRNQKGKVPTEDLLEGEIDMESLLDNEVLGDYNGWIGLELWHPEATNPTRTMTEDVQRSIDYLKRILQYEK